MEHVVFSLVTFYFFTLFFMSVSFRFLIFCLIFAYMFLYLATFMPLCFLLSSIICNISVAIQVCLSVLLILFVIKFYSCTLSIMPLHSLHMSSGCSSHAHSFVDYILTFCIVEYLSMLCFFFALVS